MIRLFPLINQAVHVCSRTEFLKSWPVSLNLKLTTNYFFLFFWRFGRKIPKVKWIEDFFFVTTWVRTHNHETLLQFSAHSKIISAHRLRKFRGNIMLAVPSNHDEKASYLDKVFLRRNCNCNFSYNNSISLFGICSIGDVSLLYVNDLKQ